MFLLNVMILYFFKRLHRIGALLRTHLNDFNDLLLPYFQVVRIKQKTNPKASKINLFMILVDSLFGKHLNKTKNPISDVAGALDLPLYLVF